MLRFNSALQKEYGGDILTGVRDGFRRMYDVTDLVQISGLYNLDAANDRRNSIGVIQDALNTLNPLETEVNNLLEDIAENDKTRPTNPSEIKQEVLLKLGTAESPYVVNNNQDFDNVPINSMFTDPNGKLRTKTSERPK
tara:strand:- start:226 stop:642 length:417 start_codon:yes stop_codon:yes gene_type:complete